MGLFYEDSCEQYGIQTIAVLFVGRTARKSFGEARIIAARVVVATFAFLGAGLFNSTRVRAVSVPVVVPVVMVVLVVCVVVIRMSVMGVNVTVVLIGTSCGGGVVASSARAASGAHDCGSPEGLMDNNVQMSW